MMAHTEYYDFLGVAKDDSDEAIKKAYRRLALKHHPDKNGDPDAFRKLTEVYETLKDPEKRRMYDQHGPGAAAKCSDNHAQPFPTGFSVEQVFGHMFGGFGGGFHTASAGARQVPKKKTRPIKHTVGLSLQDLYLGKKLRIAVERQVVCSSCHGAGGQDVRERPCVACAGRGFAIKSNGSIFQSSMRCQACDATGKVRQIGIPCHPCKSTGVGTDRVVVEPIVHPGDRGNMSYVFRGKGNIVNTKGSLPGDIIISTMMKPCPAFTRKGQNLYTSVEISLKESLAGFSTSIKHLDGRMIDVSVPKGKVTAPGAVISVKDEGIPAKKGVLFVTVKVRFPSRFSDSSIDMLDILPEMAEKNVA